MPVQRKVNTQNVKNPKQIDPAKKEASIKRKEKSNKSIVGRSALYALIFKYFGCEVLFKSPKKHLKKKDDEKEMKHYKLDIDTIRFDNQDIFNSEIFKNNLRERTREHVKQQFEQKKDHNGMYHVVDKNKNETLYNHEEVQSLIETEIRRTLKQNIFDEIIFR